MSANGRVCIGFAMPYVAKYAESLGTVTYSGGMPLARGVDVKVSPTVSESNVFRADDQDAEVDSGVFIGGTIELTVDGLLDPAERFVFGLPEPATETYGNGDTVQFTKFGAAASAPYVGVGFITTYRSAGVDSYVPTIIRKCKFRLPESEHKTRGADIEWQTQKLTADIMRDDTAGADWKWQGKEYATKAEAVADLQKALGGGAAA